ncbi:MAG: M14 family zinc carboxypeptidase [Bacteroidales bacterium]
MKFLLTVLLGSRLMLCAMTVVSQQKSLPLPTIEDQLQQWGEVYFAIPLSAIDDHRSLTKTISVSAIRNDTMYAFANRDMMKKFLDLHIQYYLLKHPQVINPVMYSGGPTDEPLLWNYYPNYPAYESLMAGFSSTYPGLCKIDTIAVLPSGRRILCAKISDNVDSHENEPEFLYTSSMHGNELTGYVLMLQLIEFLLMNYTTNPDVADLVNNVEIWICPLANPDGTFHGGNNSISGAKRYNANNVDLNRNYPDPQDGDHPDGYAWQPETIAFMEFAAEHDFTIGANFHCGVEVFNYPWDTWPILAADDNWWYHCGRAYADTIHAYSPSYYFNYLDDGVTNGYAWYEVDGGRQDYMNYFHYCREVTIELTDAFIPPAANLPLYWTFNKNSMLNYIRESLHGIRGLVTDSLTGMPVRAKVFIDGHDTDSSHVYSSFQVGNYHRYLAPGSYNLTFSAQGYHSKTVNAVISSYSTVDTIDIQLKPDLPSVSGLVIYDTNISVPLTDVTVYLLNNNNDTVAAALTDSTGNFRFENLTPGNYSLLAITFIPPGGFNSIDALLIMKHFVHLEMLTGMRKIAADVTNNNGINSVDALMVQQRFVGLIDEFPAPPWIFPKVSFTLTQGINTININSLCTGDVNASFNPN